MKIKKNAPGKRVVHSSQILLLDMPPKKRSRPIEVSETESDEEEISNTCRGCQKKLTSIGWLKKHLERSKTNCMKKYSDNEYQCLGHKSKVKKGRMQSDRESRNSQSIAQTKSLYYQKNKEKCTQYFSQYYQQNKEKMAQRYQQNREKLAQQYQENKEKIAQQYQENKEKIAQNTKTKKKKD